MIDTLNKEERIQKLLNLSRNAKREILVAMFNQTIFLGEDFLENMEEDQENYEEIKELLTDNTEAMVWSDTNVVGETSTLVYEGKEIDDYFEKAFYDSILLDEDDEEEELLKWEKSAN